MNRKGTAIKAVVFDLGGVLEYDSRQQVDSHVARSFGMGLRKLQEHLPAFIARLQTGKINERQMWCEFAKTVGKPLPHDWKTLLREPHGKHFHILEETLEIVKRLKQAGYKLGLLSNTQEAHKRKEHLKKTFPYFDFVFLSHKHGLRKPESKAYQFVLRKLGVKAGEAVFVDNVREYVSAANKIGMKGVLFQNASKLSERLVKMGLLTNK